MNYFQSAISGDSFLVKKTRSQISEYACLLKESMDPQIPPWTGLAIGHWLGSLKVLPLLKTNGSKVFGLMGSNELRQGLDERDIYQDYCCVILVSGTCLESYTPIDSNETIILKNATLLGKIVSENNRLKYKRTIYLADQLFGVEQHQDWRLKYNSLKIERENKSSLPIYLDGCRVLTVREMIRRYILKKEPRNWDKVLPEGIYELEKEVEIILYFMVNVVYRLIYHDIFMRPWKYT